VNETEDYIKAASAWSLGQIGRHTPDHAKALAQADVFRRLIDVYDDANASDDLKTKAQRALKNVLQKCTHLPALEPLLHVCGCISVSSYAVLYVELHVAVSQ